MNLALQFSICDIFNAISKKINTFLITLSNRVYKLINCFHFCFLFCYHYWFSNSFSRFSKIYSKTWEEKYHWNLTKSIQHGKLRYSLEWSPLSFWQIWNQNIQLLNWCVWLFHQYKWINCFALARKRLLQNNEEN